MIIITEGMAPTTYQNILHYDPYEAGESPQYRQYDLRSVTYAYSSVRTTSYISSV